MWSECEWCSGQCVLRATNWPVAWSNQAMQLRQRVVLAQHAANSGRPRCVAPCNAFLTRVQRRLYSAATSRIEDCVSGPSRGYAAWRVRGAGGACGACDSPVARGHGTSNAEPRADASATELRLRPRLDRAHTGCRHRRLPSHIASAPRRGIGQLSRRNCQIVGDEHDESPWRMH